MSDSRKTAEGESRGEGRRLIERAYEALDQGALHELVSVYAQDVEMVIPDVTLHGVDEVRSYFEAIRTAFPDVSHLLVSAIESDGQVACEWVVSGTHLGPLESPEGTSPPTGRRFSLGFADFLTVCDGRIARSVSYWDNDVYFTQLGLR
jgi:steroid delta-isomerase-like uncharacterized protein